MATIRKNREVGLLANLWESLELSLSCRPSVRVSVPKVSFLMCFGDEGLSEASGLEEAGRVFERRLKSKGWKIQKVLPAAGDACFEQYLIVKKGVKGKEKG